MFPPHTSVLSFGRVSIPVYKVDGLAWSEEEVNLAILLVEKLATPQKCQVIDFIPASKRSMQRSAAKAAAHIESAGVVQKSRV
ncbi:MAG: hypothetical protein GEU77_10110 [Deltaproteobacteria bacterium]|nr:hypothetical protein [Deltaproteobacteria bacterium]